MRVYIHGSMFMEEAAAQLVPAEVIAVHENSVDLRLDDGARLIDWRAKVYDQYENEIPLETVRRDFVSNDSSDLLERITALEILLTEV